MCKNTVFCVNPRIKSIPSNTLTWSNPWLCLNLSSLISKCLKNTIGVSVNYTPGHNTKQYCYGLEKWPKTFSTRHSPCAWCPSFKRKSSLQSTLGINLCSVDELGYFHLRVFLTDHFRLSIILRLTFSDELLIYWPFQAYGTLFSSSGPEWSRVAHCDLTSYLVLIKFDVKQELFFLSFPLKLVPV